MEALQLLLPRMDPNQGCTQETCDPSQSVYGYRPSLGITVVFLVLFGLSGMVHIFQGIWSKTYLFGAAMSLGCFSEILVYVAKLLLWNDPFSETGFKMSVVVLIFAPAFYLAAIYSTLKHICLTFDPDLSAIRPSWYTWIFISCDGFSIVLQAIGGGAAAASKNQATLQIGDHIIMTGLAFQIATIFAFGLFAADYAHAIYRNRHQISPELIALKNSRRFQLFIWALCVAYVAILVRCGYRLAQLAGGWSRENEVLRNEGLFIAMDGIACVAATLVLNIWHPGRCLPQEVEDMSEKLSYGGSYVDEKMSI